MRAAAVAIVLAALVAACNGRSGPLGPEYEYEEDLTLSLTGSGTLVVNASGRAARTSIQSRSQDAGR